MLQNVSTMELETAPDQLKLSHSDGDSSHVRRLSGWRLGLLTIGLCISVFLSALDITIVSTALVAIANDLHAFEQSSWVVSSYLVTYFSFLIIWAKFSDLFGRKLVLCFALVLFLAFSGACGAAATPIQLILFRAFQGIGGAGLFSMAPIIVAEMVGPERFGKYNSNMSVAIAFSFLLGPILGGAIPDSTTWRWIFWINLPIGFTGLALVLVAMPASFPDITPSQAFLFTDKQRIIRGKVDYPGFLLLLAACVLLIVALEEAGISFAWNSPLIVTFLVLTFVLLCLLFAWQRHLFHQHSTREPVIPWQFLKHRVLMATYLNALLSGVPLVTVIIELPQRFQSMNGMSALDAGVRVLPFTMTVALGSAVTGAFTAKGRVPPIFVLIAASALQILGLGLLYSVPVGSDVPARLYGYEILAGLGVGLSLTTLLNMPPFIVERKVLAVALGGVTQLRILGGAIGVAIATNLLNNTIKSTLAGALPATVISNLLENISSLASLSPADRALVQAALAEGYHKQLAMILGFCAAEALALILMWERTPRRLV